MSNFGFPPKLPPPYPASVTSVEAFNFKETLDLNRNFTNNYIASQLFRNKDFEVSSQSYVDVRPEYYIKNSANKPQSPNSSKDMASTQFSFQKQYNGLLAKYKKKEDKFKKVLIDLHNQIIVKDSIIEDFKKELQKIKIQKQSITVRQLNKARDCIREYQLLLQRSDKARKQLQDQLQKSKKNHTDVQFQTKDRIPVISDQYDTSKSKQYYVSKLIQCQNALRQRQQKVQKLSTDLVHSRSQLEYVQKSVVISDDKMSLIKALNGKRQIEDQLNRTVTRLTNELSQLKQKYKTSQQSKASAQSKIIDNSYQVSQFLKRQNQYLKQIQMLKSESKLLHFSSLSENKIKQQQVSQLKLQIQTLTLTITQKNLELYQFSNELASFKEKNDKLIAQKQVLEKFKGQKIDQDDRICLLKNDLQTSRQELKKTRDQLVHSEKQLLIIREMKQSLQRNIKQIYQSWSLEKEDKQKTILSLKDQCKSYADLINKNNFKFQSEKTVLEDEINKYKTKVNELLDSSLKVKQLQNQLNLKIEFLNKQVVSSALQINQYNIHRVQTKEKIQNLIFNNQELEQAKQKLEIAIKNLQQVNKNLKQKNQKYAMDIDNLNKELKQKNEKQIEQNSSFFQLTNQKQILKIQLLNMEKQYTLQRQKNITLQQKIQKMAEQIFNFKKSNQLFKESQSTYQSQIMQLRSSNDSLAIVKGEYQNKLKCKQDQLNQKTQQFKMFGQKIEDLIQKLYAVQLQNQQLHNQNQKLSSRLNEAEIQIKQTQQLSQSLLIQNKSILQKNLQDKESLGQEIKSLKDLYENKADESKGLENKLEQLECTLKRVKIQSQENAARLSEQLISASKAQESIQHKLSNSSKLLQEQQIKRKQVEKHLRNTKSPRSQHQNHSKARFDLESLQTMNKDMVKKLQQLKKQKCEMQSIITNLKEQIKSLKKTQKSKIKGKQTKQKQTKQKQKIEERKPLQRSKIKTVQTNEVSGLKIQIEQMKLYQEKIVKQIKDMKLQFSQLSEVQRVTKNENDDLKSKLKILEDQLEQLSKSKLQFQQNANKNLITISQLQNQISTIHKETELKKQHIHLISKGSDEKQIIQNKCRQISKNYECLEVQFTALKTQFEQNNHTLNYYIVRSLLLQVVAEKGQQFIFSEDNLQKQQTLSSTVKPSIGNVPPSFQKHIIQLMGKIQWMQQNLNFINTQNNDLQIELDQKDGQIFDLRKMVDKGQAMIKDLKVHLDRSGKKLLKHQELIRILNRELIVSKLRQGNDEYKKEQQYNSQNKEEVQTLQQTMKENRDSIEDEVLRSVDLSDHKTNQFEQ